MGHYKVWVRLEEEYDDIEADDKQEAFVIASDFAMESGEWQWNIEEIIEDED